MVNYIKENKLFCSIMLVGILLFTFQTYLVVLYADDITLSIISKESGFLGAFTHMKENYMNWGGGPTPMFAVMFLCFKPIIWKIFSIGIMAASVFMITDMVSYKNKKNMWWIAALIWSSIFILDVYISRETLYWLDGHLAYVFTTFNILIYFYYLFKKMIENTKIRKYDYVVLTILAFFAGWSGPQSGSIILVMVGLLFAYKIFFKKEKIEKIYYISFIIAIIGFLVYYLAPGNDARFNKGFKEIAELNFIELILYRIDGIFSLLFNYPFEYAGLTFYINIIFTMLLIISIYNLKEDRTTTIKLKKIIYLACAIVAIFIISNVMYKLNLPGSNYIQKLVFGYENIYKSYTEGYFTFKILIPYITTIFALISAVTLLIYVFIKEQKILMSIAIISGFLTQFVMLLAPYSPIRTVFLSVILFIIAIVDGCLICKNKKINIEPILFIILSYFGLNVLIVGIGIYLSMKSILNKNQASYVFILATISFFAMVNYIDVTNGYYKNREISLINFVRLDNYDGKSKEIILERLHNEKYAFTPIYGIEWIETDVKKFYEIPSDVEFVVK